MSTDIGLALTQLGERLGDTLTPAWREAFQAIPRHLFLPDKAMWVLDADTEPQEIDRTSDPVAWLAAAYSDGVIVTQLSADGDYTSSCSMPYMVFTMLNLADIQPRQKVLEIGTGTGWTSALMAWRLGAMKVFTVEVDPALANQAKLNHARAGIAPTVVTGDGTLGHAERAPYDRVIATVNVHRVPHAWIEQTKPGGIVLTPWSTRLGLGALLRLAVGEDGTATGRFVHTSAFMTVRQQKLVPPDEPDDFTEHAAKSSVSVDLDAVREDDARFAVGLLVGGAVERYQHDEHGLSTIWLQAEDSWASVHRDGTVHQLGARHLWDEVESAYGWWTAAGKPEYTRFGVTITPEEQRIWLDEPQHILS